MTSTDPFGDVPVDTPLGLALRERMDHERPDLEELVRSSTRAGTRIRRRRHAAITVGAAAGIAAFALGVSALDGSSTRSGRAPDFAGQPRASVTATAQQSPPTPQTREERAHARALRALQDAPVYVDSPDWRCDEPLDEKFTCTQGAASVGVTWRPAALWQDYQDPDKASGDLTSDVHGDYFVTLSAGSSTTQAQVQEVADALIWASDTSSGAAQ